MTDRDSGSPDPREQAAVMTRRQGAGLQDPDQLNAPMKALALSGGGIRSATFCLGVIRALAKNGVLRHFDYLSTVSGGGYIGSALTRLYGQDRRGREVQDGVARDDTVWLWWLRSNGRYLTPAGLRDIGQAFASIFRGVLSTHFEVGMLLMIAAAALTLPHVVLLAAAQGGLAPAWAALLVQHTVSFWWMAVVVPLCMGFHHVFAYWFWRARSGAGSTAVDIAAAALGVFIAWRWGTTVFAQMAQDGFPKPEQWSSAAACLLLLTPATAQLSRRLGLGGGTVSKARLAHTKGLANALWGVLVLGLAGLLDVGTAHLAAWITEPGRRLAVGVPSVAALIALLRVFMTRIGDLRKWAKAGSRFIDRGKLLNIAGLALLAFVVIAWVTAFQWFADARLHPWSWLRSFIGEAPSPAGQHATQWFVLAVGPLLYVLLTRANLELLNLSSLHQFYRARIERAYVSTGNAKRFDGSVLGSRLVVNTATRQMRLTEAVDDDDVALAMHTPHVFGGPIHLVNCCINQTIDDRTDNYNADRKGVCLTVSALGAETGTRFSLEDGLPVPGTLSMWAAVSGAAVSSGMGSQTSPGAAALMFLSGLRLGYWQAAVNRRAVDPPQWTNRPQLVLDEAFARFPGLRSPEWYLSDGGHFDNTGVYALLKRKARLIVLADCGADPAYRFEDLENLVRKAAIDYCCDIEFVDAPSTVSAELRASIGRPAEFAPGPGDRCLLLGRVTYQDRSQGTLVVLKPRVTPALPLDLTAYAIRNPSFPQQGTGDQFFDEAQWESYHQLGLHIGSMLTSDALNRLHGSVCPQSPMAIVTARAAEERSTA